MRVYRYICTGVIVTIMAVGYVHQRVEIVKTGYNLQKDREYLSRLVDQNSKLMYNLFKLESPRNLFASMNDEKIKFARHTARQEDGRTYRTSRVVTVPGYNVASAGKGFVGRFLDFFVADAEASPRN
ncbi:MAG: hypothetical protein WBB86_08660 [Candidatus Omnitrophota bacterium]